MSDFYSLLLNQYDTLFPAENEIVDFLEETFRDARGIIVDAACGTGNYTAALTGRGFSVVGFDAHPGMIDRARCCGREGRFLTATLEELAALTTTLPAPWGGLYCIGNSLPHLPAREAVAAFFRDAYDVLTAGAVAPGGALVVQVINFARFAPRDGGGGSAPLPAIEKPGITMHREYLPSETPGTTRFRTELRQEDSEPLSAETTLLTLRREELEHSARRAGFSSLTVYGNYDGRAYNEESSFLLVLVARA